MKKRLQHNLFIHNFFVGKRIYQQTEAITSSLNSSDIDIHLFSETHNFSLHLIIYQHMYHNKVLSLTADFNIHFKVLFLLENFMQRHDVNPDLCTSLLISYISENSKSYPMKIGEEMTEHQKTQMAVFLVNCNNL